MQGGVWAAQLLTSAFECLSPESQKMSGQLTSSGKSGGKGRRHGQKQHARQGEGSGASRDGRVGSLPLGLA